MRELTLLTIGFIIGFIVRSIHLFTIKPLLKILRGKNEPKIIYISCWYQNKNKGYVVKKDQINLYGEQNSTTKLITKIERD